MLSSIYLKVSTVWVLGFVLQEAFASNPNYRPISSDIQPIVIGLR